MFRPSSQDPEVLNFMISGDFDAKKIMESREALVEQLYETSGRRDIIFGDLVWVSKYRLVV